MKELIKEFTIIIGISVLMFVLDIRICPFYNLFKIPCPGCGLTRSMISLLKLDIKNSIQYNILGIPLIIIIIIYLITKIFKIDIDKYTEKYKKLIIIIAIILVIAVEIINLNNPLLY